MTEPTSAPPVFNQLNVIVRDMDATLTFYRRLGLNVDEERVWRTASGIHHAEILMPNGYRLEFDSAALAPHFDAGWRPPISAGSPCIVGFGLPSRDAVDARYAEMTAAGYAGSQAPYDAFWGSRYAVISDPDGNHVGLMSPPDRDRRGAPPEV